MVTARLREIIADAPFQEAVLWQKRDSLAVVLRRLGRDRSADRRPRNSSQTATASSRTTIGFGPVGWASFVDDPSIVDVHARELTTHRECIEGCIDTLAEWINEDPDIRRGSRRG
jgi:hypothetical protein